MRCPVSDKFFQRVNQAGRETRARTGGNPVIEIVESTPERLVYRVAGETETRQIPPKKQK